MKKIEVSNSHSILNFLTKTPIIDLVSDVYLKKNIVHSYKKMNGNSLYTNMCDITAWFWVWR